MIGTKSEAGPGYVRTCGDVDECSTGTHVCDTVSIATFDEFSNLVLDEFGVSEQRWLVSMLLLAWICS